MYITKDDYFSFAGIDLQLELKGTATDNPSNVVEIFINRTEKWLLNYLELNYAVTPSSDKWDLERFKEGVLHQIDYIRRNGDLSIQSASNIKLIAPNAYTAFKLGGMCNTALPKSVSSNLWV